MTLKINSKTKYTFLILLFLLARIGRYVIPNAITITTAASTLFGLAALFFIVFESKLARKLFLSLLPLTALAGIALLINKNQGYTEILRLMSYQGIALSLYVHQKNAHYLGKAFPVLIGFFLINIVLRRNIESLFYLTSSNFISVFLLLFSAFFIMTTPKNKKTLLSVYCLVSLFVCFWSRSRAGMLSYSVLVIGLFLVYYGGKRLSLMKKGVILVLLCVPLVLSYMPQIGRVVNDSVSNEGRLYFWKVYFDHVGRSFIDVLFGARGFSETSIIGSFGHLHSTYFNLHEQFGLIPLLAVIYYIVRSGITYYKVKRYDLFVVLVALFARSLTDVVAFIGPFDLILYYFFFDTACIRRRRRGMARSGRPKQLPVKRAE